MPPSGFLCLAWIVRGTWIPWSVFKDYSLMQRDFSSLICASILTVDLMVYCWCFFSMKLNFWSPLNSQFKALRRYLTSSVRIVVSVRQQYVRSFCLLQISKIWAWTVTYQRFSYVVSTILPYLEPASSSSSLWVLSALAFHSHHQFPFNRCQ